MKFLPVLLFLSCGLLASAGTSDTAKTSASERKGKTLFGQALAHPGYSSTSSYYRPVYSDSFVIQPVHSDSYIKPVHSDSYSKPVYSDSYIIKPVQSDTYSKPVHSDTYRKPVYSGSYNPYGLGDYYTMYYKPNSGYYGGAYGSAYGYGYGYKYRPNLGGYKNYRPYYGQPSGFMYDPYFHGSYDQGIVPMHTAYDFMDWN